MIWLTGSQFAFEPRRPDWCTRQSPISLMIVRSPNSLENMPCCNSITGHSIATNFCTCHDSTTVVPCAKFRSHRSLESMWNQNETLFKSKLRWETHYSWWRHQMETFFVPLALCVGNSPVNGEFPSQRPVTRSFDVFFDLRPNKQLSKRSWGWWFEMLSRPFWRHCNDLTNIAACHASFYMYLNPCTRLQ